MFQLDPPSMTARVRASGQTTLLPSLGQSLCRGIIGFTMVSIAGFLPWPIIDRWFHGMREMDLYVACTTVFISLSGICLHRLILGPGSLWRFYALFAISFLAYAAVWVAVWITLRGDAGCIGGLLGGSVAMGTILAWAFGVPKIIPRVVAALFVLNAAGYYAGDEIAGKLIIEHRLAAILIWSACYGIGFGAGIGIAFHFCQEPARQLLRGP